MARTPRTPPVDQPPPAQPPAQTVESFARANLPRRSMGLKLLLVCALALLMSIPALFVFGLLMDRSNRAESVAGEIGDMMGGPQTFLGPVIAIPYSRPAADVPAANPVGTASTVRPGAERTNEIWYVFPTHGKVDVATDSEVRKRSLFRVTVYEATVGYTARFDLANVGAELPRGAVLDWSRAELLLGASDARGARADLRLTLAGRTVALTPSNLVGSVRLNNIPTENGRRRNYRSDEEAGELQLFSTPLTEADRAAGGLDVAGRATFSGAERVAVLAFAGTTRAVIKGDWPHPSYNGGILPANQSGTGRGFEADWSVPFVARGIPVEGGADALSRLGATQLGVSFVEPANPYQSVSRSLKYAPMFVGIVFLAFFMFETITRRRVHPAQYVLVGLVQVMFYMLLLSIAEYIGFDLAFLLAAAATVALISAYAGWTFQSRSQGLKALAAFTTLYGLIYLLMRLQEGAFIVGALTAFAALAAVMYFTRKVDWYGMAGNDTRDIA